MKKYAFVLKFKKQPVPDTLSDSIDEAVKKSALNKLNSGHGKIEEVIVEKGKIKTKNKKGEFS